MVKVCRSTSATSGFVSQAGLFPSFSHNTISFHSRSTDPAQVDKTGVSCQNGGGTIVLESHGVIYAPGGQSVYDDPANGWVLVYHYFNKTIGVSDAHGDSRFGWNKIDWSTGWPVV